MEIVMAFNAFWCFAPNCSPDLNVDRDLNVDIGKTIARNTNPNVAMDLSPGPKCNPGPKFIQGPKCSPGPKCNPGPKCIQGTKCSQGPK